MLTPLELDIMKAVWQQPPVTVKLDPTLPALVPCVTVLKFSLNRMPA